MMDKNQAMRFNKKELDILKSTFGERDDLLYALRKHFLQQDMSEKEWGDLRGAMTPEVLAVLRKDILPELTDEVPLQQITDCFMLEKIKDMLPEEAWPHITAVVLVKEYTEKQFDELGGGDKNDIKLSDWIPTKKNLKKETVKDVYIELMARNIMAANLETRLFYIKMLANQGKDETPEEIAKRLSRDSNK